MISVSQDWINAQKEQLRPESNIFIRKTGGHELSKKDFQSFRYTQNGKIDNSVLPSKNIYFEIFNDNDVFNEKDLVQVYFAYFLNGAYEEAFVGNFLIEKVERPANGLVSKFTLTDNYTSPNCGNDIVPLSTQYLGGSCWEETAGSSSYRYRDRDFFERVGGDRDDVSNMPYYFAFGFLGETDYGTALQTFAILQSSTLLPKHIAVDSDFISYGLTNFTYIQDYEIEKFIQYEKPEIVEENSVSKYTVSLTRMTTGSASDQISNVEILPDETYEIYVEPDKYNNFSLSTYPSSYYGKFEEDKFILANTSDAIWQGDVSLLLWKEASNKYVFEKSTGLDGSEINVSNNFICKANWADGDLSVQFSDIENVINNALTRLANWASYNKSIKVSCRIDPRIELFDNVKIKIDNVLYSLIAENITIEYNGAFKGTITGRRYKMFLDTPVISINESTLTISAVPNATSYNIYVNGSYKATTSSLTYDLDLLELPIGNYNITVIAKADKAYDSETSNTAIYVSNKLTAPVISDIYCETVGVNIDDYTEVIEVYIDDVKIGEINVGGNNNE